MKYILALLAIGGVVCAFNSQEFLKKNCRSFENGDVLECTFDLNQTDNAAFQNQKFEVSNATKVILYDCLIPTFNENFVNKFPNATVMSIEYSALYLEDATSNISTVNSKLQKLTIINPYRYVYNTTKGLSGLKGLTDLRMFGNKVAFNKTLFANNTNLTTLEIYDVPLYNLEENSFSSLVNLKTLNISKSGLISLPKNILQNNNKLETIVLNNNKIESLPLPFFPKSVSKISLRGNQLEVISAQLFKGLNLNYLDLSLNKISVFSSGALASAKNLTYLNLSNNLIPELNRNVFNSCPNLQELYLYRNMFRKLPQDIFDDLSQLQIIVLGFELI